MSGLEYPKIQTLFLRKPNGKVDITQLSKLEFGLIKEWQITEKLNGRNIRVMLTSEGEVLFAGRKDEKHLSDQLHIKMIEYLKIKFIPDKMRKVFWRYVKGVYQKPEVCLYMEGLGSDMAAGSGVYCPGKEVSVRVIDCFMKPFWIERPLLEEFASKLGIKCVPVICTLKNELPMSTSHIKYFIYKSIVADEEACRNVMPEGVVARTQPLLFCRTKDEKREVGDRLMWKLKFKDFEG